MNYRWGEDQDKEKNKGMGEGGAGGGTGGERRKKGFCSYVLLPPAAAVVLALRWLLTHKIPPPRG